MKCPKCNANMDHALFDGVVIDRCSGCKGLWFDCGELERLSAVVDSEMLDLGLPSIGHAFDSLHQVACPRCGDASLQTIRERGHTAINIDRCPHCLGNFLDAGEFTAYKQHGVWQRLQSFYAPILS